MILTNYYTDGAMGIFPMPHAALTKHAALKRLVQPVRANRSQFVDIHTVPLLIIISHDSYILDWRHLKVAKKSFSARRPCLSLSLSDTLIQIQCAHRPKTEIKHLSLTAIAIVLSLLFLNLGEFKEAVAASHTHTPAPAPAPARVRCSSPKLSVRRYVVVCVCWEIGIWYSNRRLQWHPRGSAKVSL